MALVVLLDALIKPTTPPALLAPPFEPLPETVSPGSGVYAMSLPVTVPATVALVMARKNEVPTSVPVFNLPSTDALAMVKPSKACVTVRPFK